MSEDKLSNYEEVDLMDYLKVIWRWKYLIVLGTFVCTIVAGMVSLSLPKLYETTEVVEIGKVRDNLLADVNAVESIMMSESFTNQVISKLNLDESPARLLKRIKVQKIGRTNMLRVSVQGKSPEEAVNIAKTMAELVVVAHKDRFDKLMKLQNTYKEDLATDAKRMEEEISLRRETLKKISKDPEVNAPAVILLQQGLLEAENRLSALKDKLQELGVSLSSVNSYNTRV
ncbi:hypothetical protein DRJ00_09460, partial [Candidatus Aerophobetes bacterium]